MVATGILADLTGRLVAHEKGLKYVVRAGLGYLALDRPAKLNALSGDLIEGFGQVVDSIDAMPGIRGLILWGEGGRAFSVGADILDWIGGDKANPDRKRALEIARLGRTVFGRLRRLSYPVISIVEGYALGGGLELALHADWIIATPQACLGSPEVSYGLIPGCGGTVHSSLRMGKENALKFILGGERIGAEQAQFWGLVDDLAPDLDAGLTQAQRLLGKGIQKRHYETQALDNLGRSLASDLESRIANLIGLVDSGDLRSAFQREARLFDELFLQIENFSKFPG